MEPPQCIAKCCNPQCVVADHEGCGGSACMACCFGYCYTFCCWTPTVYTDHNVSFHAGLDFTRRRARDEPPN